MRIAASELFRERQVRTLEGAKAVAEQLLSPESQVHGIRVLTGGTDVHLLLADLRAIPPELSGRQAEDRLHEIGVTVNRNAIPFDPRPPMEASGVRIGTPALATAWLQREDFSEVGAVIATALTGEFEARREELAERVQAIVERYPLYEDMGVRHQAGIS